MPLIKPPQRQAPPINDASLSSSRTLATVRTINAVTIPSAILVPKGSNKARPTEIVDTATSSVDTWASVELPPPPPLQTSRNSDASNNPSPTSPGRCILTFPSPPPESLLPAINDVPQSNNTPVCKPYSTLEDHQPAGSETPNSSRQATLNEFPGVPGDTFRCGVCGRMHTLTSPHSYDYCENIDADLLCRLCKQPLVDPLDTRCGHTFCSLCLKNHLAVQALCPEDKQIINFLECQQSSNLVKRLLDKLLVACPNSEYCSEVLARCDLESHLAYWCRGTVVACAYQKLGCPYLGFRAQQATHRWSCQFQPAISSRNTTLSTAASSSGCGERNSVLSDASPWADASSSKKVAMSEVPFGSPCHDSKIDEPATVQLDAIPIDLLLDGHSELGISIVGGCDTPLICVIIQEIYLDGLAARDGRLRPGDQILEVNGQDFSHIPHLDACRLLSSASGPVCRLLIFRELQHPSDCVRSAPGMDSVCFQEKEEFIQVVLPKCPDRRLGIKLAGKKHCLGLYVLGLLPDGLAQMDGRIRKDDRLLEINGVDLSNGTQDQAAQLIAEANDFVCMLLSRMTRRTHMPDLVRMSNDVGCDAACPLPSSSSLATTPAQPRNSCVPVFHNFPLEIGSVVTTGVRVCQERAVVLSKQTGESLGMSVAGGVASQRGDVPIYVTNLHPNGIAAHSGLVFRGDILLAVNEIELLGLSHERAVDALKTARDACSQVTLRLLRGPEECTGGRNFIPSWLFWLQLPRYCQIPRLVVLRKDALLGLGFSIIGGNEEVSEMPTDPSTAGAQAASDKRTQCPRPIVIKSIVPGSPSFRDGRLKCGDILLSVDQHTLIDVSHTHAVSLLKNCSGEVKLRIVSWPGTIV